MIKATGHVLCTHGPGCLLLVSGGGFKEQ